MSTATTTQIQAPPGDLLHVSLDSIVLSTTNPRKQFDGPKFDELVESVRQHGVLQPVLLRPRDLDCMTGEPLPGESHVGDAYELVVGERRFRAAVKTGKSEIPAFVRDLSDAEAMELQIVENLQRQDVSALEEAAGYLALVERLEADGNAEGKTRPNLVAEIAGKVGKSERYVYARMKLSELAPEVKDAIASGRIPVSHGDELVRLPRAEQAEAMNACSLASGYDDEGNWKSKARVNSVRELKLALEHREQQKKRKAEDEAARKKQKTESRGAVVSSGETTSAPMSAKEKRDNSAAMKAKAEKAQAAKELRRKQGAAGDVAVFNAVLGKVKTLESNELALIVDVVEKGCETSDEGIAAFCSALGLARPVGLNYKVFQALWKKNGGKLSVAQKAQFLVGMVLADAIGEGYSNFESDEMDAFAAKYKLDPKAIRKAAFLNLEKAKGEVKAAATPPKKAAAAPGKKSAKKSGRK